jgi:hypothetical protein
MLTKFQLGSLKGRDHKDNLAVDGRIILEWILGNRVGRCEMDSFGSGWGSVTASCEHGNETLGSIKGGQFLDQLSDC